MMELSVKFFEGAPMVPLGELIVECDYRNDKGLYNLSNLRGISIEKKFIGTKANMDGVSLLPYKIVEPTWISFVNVTSRNGEKISLAYNDSDISYIVSSSYVVIRVNDSKKLDPLYLFLMLQRSEFDRLARFNSWGSARETYSFDDLTRYRIPLPSIEVQRQYVAAYKSLQQLAEQNEAIAEPLQKACFGFLSNLKTRFDMKALGDYIAESNDRNVDEHLTALDVVGLSTAKGLIETKANMEGVSVKSYKVLKPGQIAYVPDTSRRGDKVSLGFNNTQTEFLVSSISCVFETKDYETLNPTYLYLIFCRPEFDRLARYNSWGSARETFAFSDLMRVKIPVPSIEVQRSIVALYHCAEEARAIARAAREQLKKLAPAMVQRAANTPVEV